MKHTCFSAGLHSSAHAMSRLCHKGNIVCGSVTPYQHARDQASAVLAPVLDYGVAAARNERFAAGQHQLT